MDIVQIVRLLLLIIISANGRPSEEVQLVDLPADLGQKIMDLVTLVKSRTHLEEDPAHVVLGKDASGEFAEQGRDQVAIRLITQGPGLVHGTITTSNGETPLVSQVFLKAAVGFINDVVTKLTNHPASPTDTGLSSGNAAIN